MNKLLEIASAWIAAANPSPEEKERAEKRVATCNDCDMIRFNEILKHHYCGECGCPIKKKAFSPLPGKQACPLGKWEV